MHPDFTFTNRMETSFTGSTLDSWDHKCRTDTLKKIETYNKWNNAFCSAYYDAENADGKHDAGVIMRTIEMDRKIFYNTIRRTFLCPLAGRGTLERDGLRKSREELGE